ALNKTFVQNNVAGLHREFAAFGHGIASVYGQVHDDLLQLARIGLHRAQVGGQYRLHVNVFANQPLQHLHHVGDDHVQVHGAALHYSMAAEDEQLLGERDGALASLVNLLGGRMQPRIFRKAIHEQRAVATDDREQVVKVVGNSAGQRSERLHALCLLQLELQLTVFGDVLHCAFVGDDLRRAVPDGLHVLQDPNFLAVLADDFALEVLQFVPPPHQVLKLPLQGGVRIVLLGVVGAISQKLLGGIVAQHFHQGRVGGGVLAIRGDLEDAIHGILENVSIFFFGGAQQHSSLLLSKPEVLLGALPKNEPDARTGERGGHRSNGDRQLLALGMGRSDQYQKGQRDMRELRQQQRFRRHFLG